MRRKLLTSSGIVDTESFLTNTWNTLPESYQQRVDNNTLDIVKHQIQLAEKPMLSVVISVEAARIDNAILHQHVAAEVVLEESDIANADSSILIHNNCTNDNLHFRMPEGSGDYDDEGDKSNVHDAIPIASQRQRPTTELEKFGLRSWDVNGHKGDNANDADADEEAEASQADDGSTQNVED
jgi:hypothetical protein